MQALYMPQAQIFPEVLVLLVSIKAQHMCLLRCQNGLKPLGALTMQTKNKVRELLEKVQTKYYYCVCNFILEVIPFSR